MNEKLKKKLSYKSILMGGFFYYIIISLAMKFFCPHQEIIKAAYEHLTFAKKSPGQNVCFAKDFGDNSGFYCVSYQGPHDMDIKEKN